MSKKVLHFESCRKDFCIDCVGVPNEDYAFISRPNSKIHWYCPLCEQKVVRNIRTEADIGERCSAFLERMENRVGALEAEMPNKVDMVDVQALVHSEITKTTTTELERIVQEQLQKIQKDAGANLPSNMEEQHIKTMVQSELKIALNDDSDRTLLSTTCQSQRQQNMQ